MNVNWETIITSILSSTAFGALCLYIIRNYFLNTLRKDLENHKYSLQKEVIKSQIHASQSSEVYRKLFELIEISYGSTASNISAFQIVNDWKMANEEDVEKYLISRNAGNENIKNLTALFKSKDPSRANKLNEYIKVLNCGEAEIKYATAKNFIITNALYMTAEIEKNALEIVHSINSGNIAYSMYLQSGEYSMVKEEQKNDQEIRNKIDQLKDQIRSLLLPG